MEIKVEATCARCGKRATYEFVRKKKGASIPVLVLSRGWGWSLPPEPERDRYETPYRHTYCPECLDSINTMEVL